MENVELTILMPCLNEAKTVEICIKKAKQFLSENNINGEILIADNGSDDNSKEVALQNGAKVVDVARRGYGSALINGSKNAKGKYTVMGDSDDSYNFLELKPIWDKLQEGNDLVVGNRYKGKMEKGAMKFMHRFVGTPIISFLARSKYRLNIGDFNCGLRGYDTEKINNLGCVADGMDYASEMIIKAKKAELKIVEVPINFYKDGRGAPSHLNPIRDGIKHLKRIIKG